MKKLVTPLARAVFAFLAFGLIPLSYAVDPTEQDPAEELLKRRQLELEVERQRKAPKPEHAGQLLEPEQDKQCLPINTIKLSGAERLPLPHIDEVVVGWQGRCMGRNAINYLLARLTRLYLEAGYITTRVYVPRQNLRDGVLELIVVVGTIEAFAQDGDVRNAKRKLHWAMPSKQGEILNLRDIEQGLDQINRVPSAGARLQLKPGEERGGTVVVVRYAENDAVRGRVAIDNDGAESSGDVRLRLGVEMDNLLSINDQTSFYYVGSNNTNAVAFSFSFPYRFWTHSFTSSYSEFLTPLTVFSESFGQSFTNTWSSSRVVERSDKGKKSWGGSLKTYTNKRFINDFELAPQRLTVARAFMEGTRRTERGFWLYDIGFAWGLNLFAADDDPSVIARDVPQAQFKKWDGSFSYYRSVPTFDATWHSALSFQYSGNSLFSSEQIHVGGRYTVRGFLNSISGETGANWRNELTSRRFPGWFSKVPLSPYYFFDLGWVRTVADDRETTIGGIGFGVKKTTGRIQFDLALAMPMISYDVSPVESTQFYFRVSTKLF